MSSNSDISYWLAEVQRLQQELAERRQERDQAHAEAASWRERYEAEAKLRQRETALQSQRIAALDQEIAQLRGGEAGVVSSEEVQAAIAQITEVGPLQSQLQEVMLECDRLRQSLNAERQAHQQTRENLSVALGDAIDLLTKRQI